MATPKHRLIQETLKECSWLAKLAENKSINTLLQADVPPIPTALHFYGCVFPRLQNSQPQPQLACVVNQENDDFARKKPLWASLTTPNVYFADDLDAEIFNPHQKVLLQPRQTSDKHKRNSKPLEDSKGVKVNPKEYTPGDLKPNDSDRRRDDQRRRNEERRRDSLWRDGDQRDSVRRDSLRRDSVRRDSVRRDSLRRDSVRRDSVRRDSLRRDSLRRDSVRRDSVRRDSVRRDGNHKSTRESYSREHSKNYPQEPQYRGTTESRNSAGPSHYKERETVYRADSRRKGGSTDSFRRDGSKEGIEENEAAHGSCLPEQSGNESHQPVGTHQSESRHPGSTISGDSFGRGNDTKRMEAPMGSPLNRRPDIAAEIRGVAASRQMRRIGSEHREEVKRDTKTKGEHPIKLANEQDKRENGGTKPSTKETRDSELNPREDGHRREAACDEKPIIKDRASPLVASGPTDEASKNEICESSSIRGASKADELAMDLSDELRKGSLKQEGIAAKNDSTKAKDLQWIRNPMLKTDPATIIVAGIDSTWSKLKRVMGDSAPLSPVGQPQLNFLFHARRNRRRSCAVHAHLEPLKESTVTPHAKAYRAAWDRQEPLTLPPLCSCAEETGVVEGHLNLLVKLDQQQQAGEVSSELYDECKSFLDGQKGCAQCGGLQYMPFSLIEVPLTQSMAGLGEVCERVPLPPHTDIFSDGPKVTACFIARNPEHEWAIYKGLYAAQEHIQVAIFDICSMHFFPGHSVHDSYWIRPTKLAQDMSSISNRAGQTPLNPPCQYPLNLCHVKAPPNFAKAASFTTPPLRRIFCVSPRQLSKDFKPDSAIEKDEVQQILEVHRMKFQVPVPNQLATKTAQLRHAIALKEQTLSRLKLEATVLRISDHKSASLRLAKKMTKVCIINPRRRSPPQQTSNNNKPISTSYTAVRTNQQSGGPSSSTRSGQPYYPTSAAAARLGRPAASRRTPPPV